jgi:hypothetical protein
MAKHVLRNAYVGINGVDLSDHASSVTTESTAEEIDMTSFTASGYREFAQGFKDATFTVTFFQDYASASVHQTLSPLYDSGGTFAVHFKSDKSTATSSTNPRIELGTARMFGYTPIAGGVGEASTMDVSFRNAGTAGVTYGTTGSP